ncbi:tetratricopeptide repeat protein [Thioflexithrix psekupsensis]|uniref:Uncharacterized protein n=1 Tax=Thioflexithrix psekupsensis TaxID=1570016 RepID=A0A251XBR0_9GAMM|nr:tetratricopeptide repeat protein [Thioflexithrix psekupsensis]OUD16167.1 hypothetical protein TPSD3_00110 [Thioflexithrix psekupsensis]
MADIKFSTPPSPWLTTHLWAIQLLILLVFTLLIYGHTLDVPFYLDDFSSIEENPVIYNWQGTLAELWQFSAARIVGYWSFALNYKVHHFSLAGYHLVNILVHFLAAATVFLLVRGLLKTPALSCETDNRLYYWLPFFVALLFLTHPLQTQAVTYVVQRLASMAGLFYLLALASFVWARLAENKRAFWTWSILCLLAMALAFFTKQNTATLPIAMVLIGVIFFHDSMKKIAITSVLALAIIGSLMVILISVMGQNPFSLEAMQSLTRETTQISRIDYLATQITVLWWYIRLFFMPLGLHIDYDYPIANGFFQVDVILGLLGHLAFIAFALWKKRQFPLLAFGILFYYLAHAVESSVLPIRDVVFEHRTYLPNFGLALLLVWFVMTAMASWFNWRSAMILLTVITLVFSGLTLWRNQLWRDPIALWQDNLQKAPEKKRAWVILGKHLVQANRPLEGLQALERSAELVPAEDGTVHKSFTIEALLNIVVAMRKLERYQEALALIEQILLGAELRDFDRAKFLVNRGNILYNLKSYLQAEDSYRQAIAAYPQGIAARANLASALAARGRIDEAILLYEEILQIDPNNQVILDNLKSLR